jgi:putative pyruvate formate lyase activating enzyme
MVEIIHRIHQKGFHPTIVYNTNAYDKPEILRILSDLVDVYLPDIKYFSNEVANELSGIPNYFDVAILALREMIWQKGTSISLGDDGLIDSGVIIRHLVLPNHSDDSVLLLKALEEEFSNNLWISILSQYFPTDQVKEIKNLDSLLAKDEYLNVLDILYDLGFYRGFIQKLGSGSYYKPNFNGPVHFKK